MFTQLLALTTVALSAAAQPAAPSPQPYVVAKASDLMVNYAVSHRKAGVPENAARTAAVEIVNSALAPPQATELVKSAASYYMVNGPQVSGPQAQNLVSRASSFYDTMATSPGYKNFAKLVHEQLPQFDVRGAVDSAESRLLGAGQAYNNRANLLASKADAAYQSLKADPAGAAAIATGRQLARKVANDFQIDTEKVKNRAGVARDNFAKMLIGI